MTAAATTLLAGALLSAVIDWIAVATSRRRLEYIAKPAVMVALIGVALALHPANSTERNFFVSALALGLASDVFLMLPRPRQQLRLSRRWLSTRPSTGH